jgi:DNA-binding MarR family transcriptional regulator
MARTSKTSRTSGLRTADFVRLAAFRRALRGFLRFSEAAAGRVGLTGQHYQVMLVLRAAPVQAPVTINDLARELLIKHNSAVGLVDRLAAQDLLVRSRQPQDRRKVSLKLTRNGERTLDRLASVHRAELQGSSRRLADVLAEISGRQKVTQRN